jgi:dUTP pyrophosphatase
MGARFEKVSKYTNEDIKMPCRKTAASAGYDFVVAEDCVIPSYLILSKKLHLKALEQNEPFDPFELADVAAMTKETKAKPTLVSTGMKCKLEPNTYLELSVRSSSPLKYWLVLANGVGIIDADYYNNPDNEGEIFFQLINLSPFDIKLQQGETIGQGIIKHYEITEDDAAVGERAGGFGSTGV